MFKKVFTAVMAAAAMTAMAAGFAMAQENEKVEAKGLIVEIPAEYKDLVTVKTEDLDEDTLISVSETASIEAAEKSGEKHEGAGWLFDIVRMPEEKLEQLRCGGMDGMEVFAEDEDVFYLFCHPTDVRFVREQYEDIEEDMAQWGKLNEWASGEVRSAILQDNPQLEAKQFTNTSLDMHLAQAAFGKDVHYEIRFLGYDPMDPSALGEDDHIEDLTDDVTYEELFDQEAPDGEYIVMYFNDDDVRYDFFLAKDYDNYIREVRKIGDGEEYSTLYKATFEDNDKTSTGIMRAWLEELVGEEIIE